MGWEKLRRPLIGKGHDERELGAARRESEWR